ncbi:MAG: NUDIX hydrolase [Trueperaceae bacterium]
MLLTWHPDLALTGAERVTQVYGLCLTPVGQLLLVSQDGEFWTLPGGHPEPGETHADTLTREVWEEACARVTEHQYLGAQRVADPGEAEPYYQLRYIARVNLEPFAPAHEMRHRKLVDIDTARRLLWRGESRIAHALIDHIADLMGANMPPRHLL